MKNLVTLSVEEFLSLYNCANRCADFDDCCASLHRIYGRNFFTLSAVQAMLQFAQHINESRPELKRVVDKLNANFYVASSTKDPSFKLDVETYVKNAKKLLKASAVVVPQISYNSDLILNREDVITSI